MIPRILIAGQASGVGKTTITLGLIAAFRRRGLTVQPFKCGPDYIDPTYHALAAGRPCRNLDTWMLSPQQMVDSFNRANIGVETARADLAIIEGVMGLFDGSAYDDEAGSAAQIAKLLDAPVLLVLDIGKLARSAGALALGYQHFDPDLNLAGCILNRAGSENHAKGCANAIRSATNLPSVGWLSKHSGLTIPERHLGLIPTNERDDLSDLISAAADAIDATFDLDKIFSISRASAHQFAARSTTRNDGSIQAAAQSGDSVRQQSNSLSESVQLRSVAVEKRAPTEAKIVNRKSTIINQPILAVARDEAFSFYYPDNLDLLTAAGAHIKFFSPLAEDDLPANAAGIYLGGGFPEMYAQRLSQNQQLWQSIRNAHAASLPIYAECGGFMVLTHALIDLGGSRWPFAAIVPGETHMQPKLAALGYRVATATRDNLLVEAGHTVRGHEFHYSQWIADSADIANGNAWYIRRRADDNESQPAGYIDGNLLASYLHVHLGQNPNLARRFVQSMKTYTNEQAMPRPEHNR